MRSQVELVNVPVVRSAPWVPVAGAPAGVQTTGLVPGDSVAYETAPFTSLTEITGLVRLQLWLSTVDGGPYGQLTASLEEVAPDGTATQFGRVRRGFADLSGTPTARSFPLSTASWRIDPGNRLRLTITVTDVAEAAPHVANRGMVISHDRRMASRIDLPLVDPDRTPPAGEPPAGASFAADPVAGLCDAFGADC
jgi:predicted acyl esterase